MTGGPGHANAVGALFTALGAESPMVLLSGHAATWELGRGGFQEIRQAEMAAPVSKASWTATAAATLGRDIGEAIRIATSGRPGPVHLSLPSDLLEAAGRGERHRLAGAAGAVAARRSPMRRPTRSSPPSPTPRGRSSSPARRCRTRAGARCSPGSRPRPARPPSIMESPRGIADATLGAFPDLVRRADLIVLLGKALDFTIKWASGPAFDPNVRVIAIDPDAALVERASKEKGERLLRRLRRRRTTARPRR